MSVYGVTSSSALNQSVQSWQIKAQKIQTEFQQLGQDLQAGNLSQAQSDFSALTQNISWPLQNDSSVSQAFSALGTALQSGNLAAAQKAYSTLQQDIQQSGMAHHHHHRTGGLSSNSNSASGTLSQLFASLGTAIQSGSMTAVQAAYTALQQDLPQFSAGSGAVAQLAMGAANFLA